MNEREWFEVLIDSLGGWDSCEFTLLGPHLVRRGAYGKLTTEEGLDGSVMLIIDFVESTGSIGEATRRVLGHRLKKTKGQLPVHCVKYEDLGSI